jgi:hypothetical protein
MATPPFAAFTASTRTSSNRPSVYRCVIVSRTSLMFSGSFA